MKFKTISLCFVAVALLGTARAKAECVKWVSYTPGPNGGICCAGVACSDGSGFGSCGYCSIAKVDRPPIGGQPNPAAQLAGVEKVNVNNTVLRLRWSPFDEPKAISQPNSSKQPAYNGL